MGMDGLSGMGMPFQSLSGLAGRTEAPGSAEAASTAMDSANDKLFADVLQQAYDNGDKARLKEVCDQFESIMLSMMYKKMKATVPQSSLFEDTASTEVFQDMLDDELMQRAGNRGIGLSNILFKQLSQQMDRVFVASDISDTIEEMESKTGDNEPDR